METSDTEHPETYINWLKNNQKKQRGQTEQKEDSAAVQYFPSMSRDIEIEGKRERGRTPGRSENTNHHNWFCASLNKNIRHILNYIIRLTGNEAFCHNVKEWDVGKKKKSALKMSQIQCQHLCITFVFGLVNLKKTRKKNQKLWPYFWVLCTWHNVAATFHFFLSQIFLPARST